MHARGKHANSTQEVMVVGGLNQRPCYCEAVVITFYMTIVKGHFDVQTTRRCLHGHLQITACVMVKYHPLQSGSCNQRSGDKRRFKRMSS